MGFWKNPNKHNCIVVSIGEMAIPIYFEMLDNNSGNSNWKDRIKILESLKIGYVLF